MQASPLSRNIVARACCASQNDIFVICLFVHNSYHSHVTAGVWSTGMVPSVSACPEARDTVRVLVKVRGKGGVMDAFLAFSYILWMPPYLPMIIVSPPLPPPPPPQHFSALCSASACSIMYHWCGLYFSFALCASNL